MKAFLFALVFVLLSVSLASAAEIHGTVYGPSLNKITDIVVEIDSSPAQRLVSKTGEYSFNVNPGRNYTITAKSGDTVITEESVFIAEEGSFIIDLFIFPDFSFETNLLEEIEEPALEEELFRGNGFSYVPLIIAIVVIVLIVLFFVYRRKPAKKEEKELLPEKADLEKVIDIIKKEGGRITQKDLRKHFPLSEAKVSLMITELESKGKIKKIKKGRGNIIILK